MLPVSNKCLLWMIHKVIVWIKTFCVWGWLLFLCLPHLDQYYQCSSHLAPPPARTARDPNMTAQCSVLAPALATFTIFTHIRHATNIFIVSLTFYIITHICLGLRKTQSSICTDSFCKIYQLSMACYQFYLTEGICILRTHYIITYQQILMS